MLEKLAKTDHKITNDEWKQNNIQEFMFTKQPEEISHENNR